MNQLQILVQLLAAAIADPAKTSIFTQTDINKNVKDPFLGLMPRVTGSSYNFEAGSLNMLVTPLLPVAMNSPFPQVGAVAPDVWKGETDKYAGEIPVDEPTMRGVQDTLLRLAGTNNTAGIATAQAFVQKLLTNLRDAADLSEKIARSEAVMTGKYLGKAKIFGAKGAKLIGKADYGVNRITAATAYDQPGSTFWADLGTGERKLSGSVQKRYISEATYVKVKANAANGVIETGVRVQNDDGTYTVTISRLAKKADGSYDTLSQNFDAEFRDVQFTVVKTQKFKVPAADGKLAELSFGTDGTIALYGAARVGQLYVAPTVEGTFKGVALDRFSYIAQPRDFEIAARCVENFVPVVEDYQNVCIIETGMTFA